MTSGPRSLAFARLMRARLAAGALWIPVSGRSMAPAIEPGRVLVGAGRRRPRRGEIWVYVGGDERFIVHRFRSQDDGRAWFRGDANDRDDPAVDCDAIIGIVIAIEDQRGHRRVGARARVLGRIRFDLLTVQSRAKLRAPSVK